MNEENVYNFVCYCMNCIGQDEEEPIIDYNNSDLDRIYY